MFLRVGPAPVAVEKRLTDAAPPMDTNASFAGMKEERSTPMAHAALEFLIMLGLLCISYGSVSDLLRLFQGGKHLRIGCEAISEQYRSKTATFRLSVVVRQRLLISWQYRMVIQKLRTAG